MIQEIICLAILYICLIGWLNAPKPTTTTEPEAAPATPPAPKTITQPMPKPAYVVPAPKAIAVPTTTEPAQDLAALPIRELYARASAKGIKRYKSLRKAELIAALQ